MMTSVLSKQQAFRFGALACMPMIVGGIPFGIIFGTLANNYELPVWVILLMSSLVFAGSAQFVVLGLMASGASLSVLLIATFIVNLRHLLYAADMLKFFKTLSFAWRAVLGFGLTDEAYAAIRPNYQNGKLTTQTGHYAFLGAAVSFYLAWNVCTALGIMVGEAVPQLSQWGLEYSMVVTFISIICPYLKSKPYWAVLGTSALSSLVFKDLPNNLGLMVAVVFALIAGFLCQYLQHKTRQPAQ